MNRLTEVIKSRKWLVIPPIVIGMIVFGVILRSRKDLPRVELTESALPLQVIRLEPQSLRPQATGYGTAKPSRIWTAIAEVPGSLVEVDPDLDSGQPVRADQLLVRIDETDYKLRVEQRRADLSAAEAQLRELQASKKADEKSLRIEQDLLDVSAADLARLTELRDQQATSVSAVDQARSTFLMQTQSVQKLKNSISLYPSRIASAKSSVLMAKARLNEALRDLDRTRLVSPFDGVLADVVLEAGQVVGQNERLFEVRDSRVMEIEAQFSLGQLDNLIPSLLVENASETRREHGTLLDGISAEVIVRSGRFETRWKGKPVRISDSVNPSTRTLGIIIRVDNQPGRLSLRDINDSEADGSEDAANPVGEPQPIENKTFENAHLQSLSAPLRAGTFCEVILHGPPLDGMLTVPRTSLDNGSIYVVDRDGRLQRQDVELGFPIGEQWVIVDGLAVGDQVAVKPPLPAIEGMLIDPKIVNHGAPSSDAARVSLKEQTP